MSNYYKIWIDKYGEVEAKRRQAEKTEKHRLTQKAKMDLMTPEERSLKYGTFGVDNPAKKPENRKKISEAVTNSYDDELRMKRSNHLRENNPSKLPGASERISKHRIEYYEDPENREKTSAATIKQYEEGRSTSGRTKNFTYTNTIGETYIVQGSYELAFIKWLDNNNMTYRCHVDRITYTDGNVIRTYLPDFFVYDWDAYIDVKSTYWYDQQKSKFEKIFASNPGMNLKILLEHDLKEMSII